MENKYHGSILVVDDERRNRDLLSSLLQMNNYQVSEAENGKQALQKAQTVQPDVILLDVMMPEMDGFEVCRILKKTPSTAPIPVIMVTVLSDRESRLKAIDAGANEFLTKPIDKDEVRLRVHNAVYSKHLHDQVLTSYEQLKELTILRDNLTHMIIHDLRQPITAIGIYLEYIQKNIVAQKITKMVASSRCIVDRLIEMINSLLDIQKLEEGKLNLKKTQCELISLVQKIVDVLRPTAEDRTIQIDSREHNLHVLCDQDLIRRVVCNLIGNAIKFTQKGDCIRITIDAIDGISRIAVIDTGVGIPKMFHDKIFEKFGQVEMKQKNIQYSTGLGLAFCKMVIEAHEGEIGVESEPGKGSTFWFVLPGEK